ncbi:MAG: hypothetical protein JST75_05300 [Bacteroidetes bacterium]|nr:hypothetical protein [Bacteroidota bacterium]
MRTISTSGKVYDLYWTTGQVVSAGKNMETRVHGGGGGGYSYQGTGSSAPITITSTTVVHDQIFLLDKSGREHSFQLQNFNVACREGNELTVSWAIKKGSKTGPYIVSFNRTTGQVYYNDGELKKIFRYPAWYPLIATLICFFIGSAIGWGITLIAIIAIWSAWIYLGSKEVKRFKTETDFNELK